MKEICVVTGGATGIGRAVVRRICQDGHAAAVCCRDSVIQADALCRELTEAGFTAVRFRMDVTQEASVRRAVDEIAERMGAPTMLVNNAGVARQSLFTDATDEETRRLVETDLLGAMRVTKAILPHMIRAKKGAIVNIASMWGQVGASCEVDYSAAKAGLIGFTKALAKETAPSGVRVNCVSPGCVDTAMMASFSQEELAGICEEIPMGRVGTPEEIANAVAFLLGGEASYITGQVLGVNGGMVV